MDKQLEIIQSNFLSKELVSENIFVQSELTQTQNVLPNDRVTKTLNLPILFNNERNTSTFIRFGATINPYFSNVLFNYSGDDSYLSVAANRIPRPPLLGGGYFYNDSDIIVENNGWFSYKNIDNCNSIILEPNKSRFDLTQEWFFFLSYPFSTYEKEISFNGVNIRDGIAIRRARNVNISGRDMLVFETYINHGLQNNSLVTISSSLFSGLEGDFTIYRIGDEDNKNTSRSFVIDSKNVAPLIIPAYQLKLVETKNGIKSQYISRWFKRISEVSPLTFIKNGFARTLYSDNSYNIQYNDTINVADERDYLNRPITEIYLTSHKKPINGFWTNVQVGLKSRFDVNYSINSLNTINNNAIEISQSTNSVFFGDIVAYNESDFSEVILEKAQHRFNSTNREENNYLEGYYYEAHKKINFKVFNGTIQNSLDNQNIPEYATLLPDGVLRWLDINPLTQEITNPSFLNGCHYLYDNLSLYLKRQYVCNMQFIGNPSIYPVVCDEEDILQHENVSPILQC